MKTTILFILLASIGVTHASAAVTTKWATGVSETEGWYDVNKTSEKDVDDYMCYAASAANLVAWWQAGSGLVSTAPQTSSAIWNRYKEGCVISASGGDPLAAVNWWLSGVYLPTTTEETQRNYLTPHPDNVITLETFSGYYYDEYALSRSDLEDFFLPFSAYQEDLFGRMLDKGMGVSLTLAAKDEPLAHAITLWGVEYTDNALSKLWVTDSDDFVNELIAVDVKKDANTGYIHFDKSGDIGFYDKIGYINNEGVFTKYNSIYVSGLYAINAPASQQWQLVASIPEPTTPALSLLALAALAARRRRNAS